jgi:hypothetical protein
MPHRPHLALVVEPRFSGGTSSAVAQEIRTLHRVCDLSVIFVESRMFRGGRTVNPRIAAALQDAGIEAVWNPPVVRAETVVIHNPSFVKFDESLPLRFNCGCAVVVSHENFLRPNGEPGFDVARCLRIFADKLPPCPRFIAPVSAYNRRSVARWLADQAGPARAWQLAPVNWFNICEFAVMPPSDAPRDRRGRISRAGFEKFPGMQTMLAHFPAHAERCAILGGDSFLLPGVERPGHWEVLPFGGADVDDFLGTFDFFVYFTHPNWRESFGRVLAEAIAAGKVVITDPGTAESFGTAVIPSDGSDIDAIIARFCTDPASFGSFVRAAQASLARFSPDAFRSQTFAFLDAATHGAAA